MKTFFQGLTFPELALAGKEQEKRAAKGHNECTDSRNESSAA
ncbi:hypothetical protein [Aeribacillus pallidus]|nr:hypothetical protein [Aeribacillus pallidus]